MAEANNYLFDHYNQGGSDYVENNPNPRSTEPEYPRLDSPESQRESKAKSLESQKETVRKNFQELRDRLYRKENLIIDSLDKDTTDNETENRKEQLEKLYETKKNLEESMKDPLLAHSLNASYANIIEQIGRNEKILKVNMFMKWSITECETAIENVCVVCEGKNIINTYTSKRGFLWESVAPGSERTQVNVPVGMTIEPKTDRILIADGENNRIQVFSNNGDHLFQIPLTLGKVLYFSFLGESIFLIAMEDKEFCITRMESIQGKIISRTLVKLDKSYNDFYARPNLNSLFLVDMKRNATLTLTACIYKNNHRIWTQCLCAENLDEISRGGDGQIELHSPHIKDFTSAVSVKMVGITHKLTLFYVLFQNSRYVVQVFNWNGEVVRSIIDNVKLINVLSMFLVDQENNIIICTLKRSFENKQRDNQPTEYVFHNLYSIYIHTDDGNRQHKLTHKSTNRVSVMQSLLKPFQRKSSIGYAKNLHVVGAAPYFGACLNSKQVLMVLNVSEHSSMLRAF